MPNAPDEENSRDSTNRTPPGEGRLSSGGGNRPNADGTVPDENRTSIGENQLSTDAGQLPKHEDAGPPATLDGTVFHLLENQRRRYLLYCLLHHEGELSLSRAVDLVTAWESDCSVEEVRSTDRRCVYSALRRRHIPRLETQNVVAYDEDAGTVSLGLDADRATQWLVSDGEERWSKYYLGLAAVSAVAVSTEFLAELPAVLPDGAEHAIIAVSFLALTALAVYDHRR